MSKDERRTRRFLLKAREKNVLRIRKQLDALYAAQRHAGKVKIDPPRRAGWKRFFVLRTDIKNRSDATVIARLLDRINVTVVSRKGDFMVYDYKQGCIVPVEHKLRTLTPGEYSKLSEQEKSYFFLVPGLGKERYNSKYEFKYPWMFDVKQAKHYITELPMLMSDIDSEIQRLRNKIRTTGIEKDVYEWHGDADGDDPLIRARIKVADEEIKKASNE